MIAGHLFFGVMRTAYILVAILFEERDLVRACGKATESIERRSRCCSHCGCERDSERYFVIETVLRSSWIDLCIRNVGARGLSSGDRN
jgi:hypothetical protein